MGARRGAASPVAAAEVNGGGGEVGEEDGEMRVESLKGWRGKRRRGSFMSLRSLWRPLGFSGIFYWVAQLVGTSVVAG